jgi:acetyl-CoA carboxylase biotin carboxyl carrier protein
VFGYNFSAMMKVSLEAVEAVARLLRASSLAEIEIAGAGETEGCRLRVRRAVAPVMAPMPAPAAEAARTPANQGAATQATSAQPPTGASATGASATSATRAAEAPAPLMVRALSVGVYHLPAGGLEPGAIVQAGQAVGVIESLRIPSEVFAPLNARVAELLVEEGQGVGYDQPLVRLEALADAED